MANIREIQSRINSVKDTMKITNAMYMISSSKMTQAEKNWRIQSRIFMDFRVRFPVSCAMCQRSGIRILMPERIFRQSRKKSVRS